MSVLVKRTGGGKFEPAAQRYLAIGAGGWPGEISYPPHTLIAVNEIMTSDKDLVRKLEDGGTVFLDSGIFSLTNHHMRTHPGMTMDQALALAPSEIDGFDELFTRYVDVALRYENDLWGYVELDQGGMVNKRKTRARLEDIGLRPIPVYHPLNDGWEYFDELAEQYDRICVGNIVQASPSLRAQIAATIWERHRTYPDLWIHGLGMTASPLLHAYPFDSVDSSAWLAPLRWQPPKSVTADLEIVSDHEGETHRVPGVRRERHKAVALAPWTVHSATVQWRAHAAEMAELGIPGLPPRDEREVEPCPSP